MLRHHDITVDAKIEGDANTLERCLERLPASVRREERTAMITRERNEVALSGFVKPLQAGWHRARFLSRSQSSKLQGRIGGRYPTQAKVTA
jgi:hypothetical protein